MSTLIKYVQQEVLFQRCALCCGEWDVIPSYCENCGKYGNQDEDQQQQALNLKGCHGYRIPSHFTRVSLSYGLSIELIEFFITQNAKSSPSNFFFRFPPFCYYSGWVQCFVSACLRNPRSFHEIALSREPRRCVQN